ncbi:transposase [candidate division WWE3 bacterium CG_4_10_14_0_2_um_filter_41_14]|uniref:Transposase n=1 Tax=candidate division WWE3 bacterium CG_4_10_14_0_2_um_filter_41_14 TaxID=1975072 RepID=A0A2M7TEI2_UNCKA|nr:MAG: transposase [candidate division WWE3 bacterium CG_4_10_14_0_2_um_filter_41_14]
MFVVVDNLPKRKPIRLDTWDYANAWWYFVTIVVQNRKNIFGSVPVGAGLSRPALSGSPHPVMELNDFGNIVNNWWYEIPEHFKNVRLDEWQIMPNHVHGIIQINSNHGRGNHAPTTLGQIVGYYKYQSTKQFNAIVGAGSSRPNPKMWQRGYYDRVIRNDRELDRIRTYIVNNPKNWLDDEYCL